MTGKKFRLKIITPFRVVYDETVDGVKAPGLSGNFGVLANHLPMLTALGVGVIEVDAGSSTILFATSGGYSEVFYNEMTILAETAEPSGEIDPERAARARDRALERLKSSSPEIDVGRARSALARSLNRLHLSGAK